MDDSIAKHVWGHQLSRKVEKYKVYVKSLLDTEVMLIEGYVQTPLREIPTYTILQIGPSYILNKFWPNC